MSESVTVHQPTMSHSADSRYDDLVRVSVFEDLVRWVQVTYVHYSAVVGLCVLRAGYFWRSCAPSKLCRTWLGILGASATVAGTGCGLSA